MRFKPAQLCFYALAVSGLVLAAPACADTPQSSRTALDLARQFATTAAQKFDAVDRALGLPVDENRISLPDGENLLFNVAVAKGALLENIITAEVHNRGLLFSLRDTLATLKFPIAFDGTHAEGWYIRENKTFELDSEKRTVKSAEGAFRFSDRVIVKDADVWVPADEIGVWFGFGLKPVVNELKLDLKSTTPLPVEEMLNRRTRAFAQRRREPAGLPLKAEPAKGIDFPFVDVSSRYQYSKLGDADKASKTRDSTITTTGDFAYGTLATQTRVTQEHTPESIRATYRQETLEPELLGPLKARKYELGDVNLASQPLTGSRPSGLGFHVTNADPLRGTLDANTDISGYASPGWDVELYRGNQLLDTQTIGEDGRYNFAQVALLSGDNNFRVVLYGPQGEVREEPVYVPVDTRRLTKAGTAYDVSLTFDRTKIYSAQDDTDEDHGKPRIDARMEQPIGNASRVTFGLQAGQHDGSDEVISHAGLSTIAASTLLNLNTAMDEQGETAAELIARRSFGEHLFRNTTQIYSEGFDIPEDNDDFGTFTDTGRETFKNSSTLTGPLGIGIGNRPRYNLALDYAVNNDDEATTSGIAGFNTGFGRLSFNQQFRYVLPDEGANEIDSLTALSGTLGRNRLRLSSQYEIKPEKQLQNLRATWQRPLGDDLSLDVTLDRYFEDKLTEGSAQVNWQAGHVLLSPGIAYNSDGDVRATLNSRFGAVRDPQSGNFRMFDHAISLNGGLSAFVFLDQNGDGLHQEGEPPIEGAVIAAPQNGGRAQTGEDGYAYFSRLQRLRLTDVYIEPDSLKDPYWVPATKGVSILPREGHVSQVSLPVVMAGEIEGAVYTRDARGTSLPARGMTITIYTRQGEKVAGTISDVSGYYLISPLPPGDYVLVAGNDTLRNDAYERPVPSDIHIGYEGTVINGHDIYMDAGLNDAPVRVFASAEAVETEQPGLKIPESKNQTVVLNLGSYHSRLLMSLTWYKARNFQPEAVQNLDTLVAPADSFAAPKTGLHTLRLGARNLSLEEGRKRCGMLNAAGIKCTLEILPGTLQMAGL